MKRFQEWKQSLSVQDVMWLSAVFLASLLGTAVSGLVLKWGLTEFGQMGSTAKLAVSLGATAAYGGSVILVFYVFFPETKLALKRIWKK
jgi:hypothetical protein